MSASALPEVEVRLRGPLVDPAQAASASEVLARVEGRGAVRVSLAEVPAAGTLGLAALASGVRALRAQGRSVRVVDVDPEVSRRAALVRLDQVLGADAAGPRRPSGLDRLGAQVSSALGAGVVLLAMLHDGVRHSVVDCASTALGREHLARQVDQIGARAAPIVAGVTFLIGAIMALQTAYVVAAYGGAVFVARGVAVSMVRELGPLMAALLLAGRSGSAIAAELGAMVVYEETDALEMMALQPRRFLLSPRFVALCLAVPGLALLADGCGILGGAAVMVVGYDIGWATYYDQTIQGVFGRDVASGLIKSVFFGALIAVVACRRGLTLRGGPEAVGRAATAAVVDAILAVVIFDAAFTLATHRVL